MSNRPHPTPNQGEMFTVNPVNGNEYSIRELTPADKEAIDAGLAVGIDQRNTDLLEAIDAVSKLPEARKLDGLARASRMPIYQDKLSKKTPAVEALGENAGEKARRLRVESRESFQKVTGIPKMIEKGVTEIGLPEGGVVSPETLFISYYRDFRELARSKKELAALKNKISDNIDFLHRPQPESDAVEPKPAKKTGQKRTKKSKATTKPEPDSFLEEADLPDLDTPKRLQVLAVEDPRAGFLPATHMEKNWALALLDYIDSPSSKAPMHAPRSGHPAQTAGQLNEVFLRQKGLHKTDKALGIEQGQRAVRSIMFVFGDFLANAQRQKEALITLMVAANEVPNPKISIGEELGPEHPGVVALVRYLDIRGVMLGHPTEGITFDPLRTKAVRENVEEPDRNKYVEDQYTAPEIDQTTKEYIAARAQQITFGDIRTTKTADGLNLAEAAALDQEYRSEFWIARLREARSHLAARPIAQRILASLDVALR